MSALDKQINACLNNMHKTQSTGKGSYGEQSVLKICESFYQSEGGILYHSYTYRTDATKEGNIKRDSSGKCYLENVSGRTEIDILYISKHKVFPIEVKAYKAKQIVLTTDSIQGCFKTDKSPVHQNEMHCRHLYPELFKVLPSGNTDYIVPIVCFVDKCKVTDNRTPIEKQYMYCTILNNLRKFIKQANQPLEYNLDLTAIQRVLTEMQISCEKHLPVRL